MGVFFPSIIYYAMHLTNVWILFMCSNLNTVVAFPNGPDWRRKSQNTTTN